QRRLSARRRLALRRAHEAGGDRHCFFFSSRRRHTRSKRDWSSDVCSSDLSFQSDTFAGLANSKIFPDNTPSTINSIFSLRVNSRSEERRVGKECRSRSSP